MLLTRSLLVIGVVLHAKGGHLTCVFVGVAIVAVAVAALVSVVCDVGVLASSVLLL